MTTIAAQVLTPIRAILRWWLSEIAGLVPAKLKHLSVNFERLVIRLERADGVISVESPRAVRTLGSIHFGGQDDPRQQLQSILRQCGLSRALSRGRLDICIRMPPSWALRVTLELPAAAEENLYEVVGFELDRHTPFRADQVQFTCRVLKRDALAQWVTVEVTVVPRTTIEKMREIAARLGLDPDRVDVAGDAPTVVPSENLLAYERARAPRPAAGKLSYGLAAMAAILAITAVMIPVHAARQRVEALERELAALKKTVEAVASLQKEVDTLREEEGFLVDRKRSVPTVTRVLFDLTKVLPDDTWLNEVQLAGRDVQIIGFTASASNLIGLLEQSRTFRNTTFRSPVTRDPRTDLERFHIAARVVQEAEQ